MRVKIYAMAEVTINQQRRYQLNFISRCRSRFASIAVLK